MESFGGFKWLQNSLLSIYVFSSQFHQGSKACEVCVFLICIAPVIRRRITTEVSKLFPVQRIK
jgi:hypothetical protein